MNTDTSPQAVGQRLDEILAPPSADLVAAFFNPEGPFAGATFDALGSNDRTSINIDDLLAITLLNVAVRPPAVRKLLGVLREQIALHLTNLEPDLDLWNADDRVLDRAGALWDLLDNLPGVGPVIAGKLLARKRPRLIPIVDRVVVSALACQEGTYWATFRACLTQDRREAIEALRPGDVDARISTLRLMDVAIWMRHSQGQNARAARDRWGSVLTSARA